MRIGVLGGTFDPPHIGHLLIAEAALSALNLDYVYFIPARLPPHKLDQVITPLEHRVNMLRLALGDNPRYLLSLIEAFREGPSYTVDTLVELSRESTKGSEFLFIMGMDSLAELPTWHEPRELIKLCKLAVLRRPGFDADLDALEEVIPGLKSRVVFVPAPAIDISSHELQSRIRSGQSIKYLIPTSVDEYIQQNHLYRD